MDVTASLELDTVSQVPISLFSSCCTYRGQLSGGAAVAIKATNGSWYHGRTSKALDIWSKCSHPNIVQLIGRATFRGLTAGVYVWHEYGSIRGYLGHHPTTDRYRLGAHICEGMAYLHANGIIHGYLRGDQILVSSDGVPRIQLSARTSSNMIDAVGAAGYVPWMAPELFKYWSKNTLASDVYALGMTILETITGDKPYGPGTPWPIIRRQVSDGELPPRPTENIPDNKAGNAIWDIFCECWSYKPEDRPSAKQVCEVMHIVHTAPDGAALTTLRLAVTEVTTIRDLVVHFEQRRLINFTRALEQSGIASADPLFDCALANVFRITLLNRQCVAVKCVKHKDPYRRLKRAARELSCWLTYKHENILPLLGFAVVKEKLAMVSPWMHNGNITEYVAAHPGCNRLGLCTQLARAIAYIHENNVVHGDIKGPNVLVSDTGTVQVADFGTSIMEHQEILFTATRGGGTEPWQAPEILLGKTDSTTRADVYALGMTMIEIYTGGQPYGSAYWPQLRQSVIYNQLRPPRPIGLPINNIGNGVWGLMNHCWAAEPFQRPTSDQVYAWLHYRSSTSA